MAVLHVTKEQFEREILSSEKPVVLDFWATWCGPCQMMAPVIDQLAEERPDLLVGKIDVDEQPELASMFQISSIPTIVVMEQGKVVKRELGFRPYNALVDMIDG